MSGDCLSAAAERCRIDDVLDFIDRGLKSMPYYGVTSRATPALWKTQSNGGACSLPFAQGIRHLNEQRLQLPEPPGAHSRGAADAGLAVDNELLRLRPSRREHKEATV